MNALVLKVIGQICLWTGFLGASFSSVSHLENKTAPWQTIPWVHYGVSMAVAVVGVVALRGAGAMGKKASGTSTLQIQTAMSALQAANKSINELSTHLDSMCCEDVLAWIDDQCVVPLAEFADARHVMQNRMGTQVYAEVMTEFASGERYLNRAWSAAADGYVDEVERSVKHAKTFLNHAWEILELNYKANV